MFRGWLAPPWDDQYSTLSKNGFSRANVICWNGLSSKRRLPSITNECFWHVHYEVRCRGCCVVCVHYRNETTRGLTSSASRWGWGRTSTRTTKASETPPGTTAWRRSPTPCVPVVAGVTVATLRGGVRVDKGREENADKIDECPEKVSNGVKADWPWLQDPTVLAYVDHRGLRCYSLNFNPELSWS